MAERLIRGQWVPMTTGDARAVLAKKPSKYRSQRCEWKGEKFDSRKELERHLVLLDMQAKGEISELKRQPKYRLIVEGVKICDYIPDWDYIETKNTQVVAEDAKGFQTPEFKLKWKLAKALFREVDWRLS